MHEIEPKPSRLLGLLLTAMGALALVAIRLAALPEEIQLLLGAGVIGVVVWGWRRARWAEAVRITGDGQLQCLNPKQAWRDVEVLGDSLVSPLLVVLRYRFPDQPVRTMVLLPDSAESADLRRLRVSLRWAGRTRSDTRFPGAG